MKNFAITGVAGYIAPRHLKAIKETGNRVVAATDPHDSVGIMDSYFPDAAFFTEFERFDRHIEKLKRTSPDERLDYLSICSPNHLHDAHIRLALRAGADAICEKPLVLNPWNLDILTELEEEYKQRVWTLLQLRVHPSIIALKQKYEGYNGERKKITLSYVTSRGTWYHHSWKGDLSKSGGIATNIGIHFFDMLMWIFGKPEQSEIHKRSNTAQAGFLRLPYADVEWFLSIDENDLPEKVKQKGQRIYRSITIDEEEIEFSDGFTDLHTIVYQDILNGKGFGLKDAYPSIKLVSEMRNQDIETSPNQKHPFLGK